VKNLKKALVLLVAIAIGAVTVPASASTLIAPFFSDAGTLMGPEFTPQAPVPASASVCFDAQYDRDTWGYRGQATFIALSNIGTATAVVAVTYTDQLGVDATPTPNTFEIGVKQSVVGRPVRRDPFAETTPGAELPDNYGTPLFPKAVQIQGVNKFFVNNGGGGANGGAVFETATPDAELAGAIRVFSWSGFARDDQSTEQAPLFRP